jgi:hypothetical protein
MRSRKMLCLMMFAVMVPIALAVAPGPAKATSYIPGYEPYLYGYMMNLNPAGDPTSQYLGFLSGNWSRADIQSLMQTAPKIVYKFSDNSNVVASEWYAFIGNVWVVYYNPAGYATQIIIIPREIQFDSGGGPLF